MRLSEAIRAGAATGVRQIKDRLVDYDSGGHDVCAMGAAWIGVGLKRVILNPIDMTCPDEVWPAESAISFDGICPIENCAHDFGFCRTIFSYIAHLNDWHIWTFDQIADWVQAQEAIHGIADVEGNGPHGATTREMVSA